MSKLIIFATFLLFSCAPDTPDGKPQTNSPSKDQQPDTLGGIVMEVDTIWDEDIIYDMD